MWAWRCPAILRHSAICSEHRDETERRRLRDRPPERAADFRLAFRPAAVEIDLGQARQQRLEVFLGLRHRHQGPRHFPAGGRRPRWRRDLQLELDRLEHTPRPLAAVPHGLPLVPLLEPRIEPHLLKLVPRPLARRREAVRTGQPAADVVAQVVLKLHHPAVLESLVGNPIIQRWRRLGDKGAGEQGK